MPKPDLESLRELIQPSLRYAGVDLFDLKWTGRALSITIDRPGGVTLDDCEKVSMSVGATLDAFDPIDGRYQLEVTSPGAERPIRNIDEWRLAIGKHVLVHYRSDDAEVSVQGLLAAVGEDSVTVTTMKKTRATDHQVPLADVVSARIAVVI